MGRNEDLNDIAEQLELLADRVRDMSGEPASRRTTPGRRLAQARNKALLTQQELAKKSGVAVNTIINFENDHTRPRYRTLMALAEAVDIDWTTLTDG